MKLYANSYNTILAAIQTRCQDYDYKEIPKSTIEQAISNSIEEIATEFGVLIREFRGEVTELPIKEVIPDWNGEIVVKINDITCPKSPVILEEGKVLIESIGPHIEIKYLNSKIGDKIYILYNSNGVGTDHKTNALLPAKYNSEIVRRSLILIAEIGLAKYAYDEVRKAKYKEIMYINSKKYTKTDLHPSKGSVIFDIWGMP